MLKQEWISVNPPHVRRENTLTKPDVSKGCLKNGNPSGDLSKVKKCGARSKRHGNPCRQPAMKNGRCRFHGGFSKGPITFEGREKARKGNWKHGAYSQTLHEVRENIRQLSQNSRGFMKQVFKGILENSQPKKAHRRNLMKDSS